MTSILETRKSASHGTWLRFAGLCAASAADLCLAPSARAAMATIPIATLHLEPVSGLDTQGPVKHMGTPGRHGSGSRMRHMKASPLAIQIRR